MVMDMQKKKSIKELLLVLVCAHDGKYTWYQLERELEWRGLAGKVKTSDITDVLEKDLLITKKIKSNRGPALPVYNITDSGRAKARELVDQYGLECFKIKKQNPDDYEL